MAVTQSRTVAGRLATLLFVVATVACSAPSPSASGSATPPIASPRPSESATSAASGESAASSASALPSPSATSSPNPNVNQTIAQLLARLSIATEQRTGYARSLFPLWIDADGDGCNTRFEVLITESRTPVTVGSGCKLTGGTWFSVYDGITVSTPPEISIDHLVALAEAWDSGASAWTTERRQAFANDLDVPWTLIAVTPASNESKADMDPADWLPPRAAARCDFLADLVATKVRWALSVDQREHDAIAALAGDCPGTTRRVVVVGSAGPLATPPSAAPGGEPSACDPAYPTVCIPPPPPDLDCGEITFRRFTVLPPDPHHFDGDGNGIGCER